MNRFGKISIFAAGLMFPASAFIGGLIGWNLKSSNPNNVDITQGLAYLRPILVTGFVLFIGLLLTSFIAGIIALKKDTDRTFGKIGLVLLAIVLVFSAGAAFANAKTDDAINSYRTKNERVFFDTLDKQKTNQD
jgi:uncharacterized Tic20 family protein